MEPTTTTTDDGREREARELAPSDRYRILAAEYRRALLEILADREPPIPLDGLAAAIAARSETAENDRVRLRLHHERLPRLDDSDVLEYEADDRRVTGYRETRVRHRS